MSNIGHHLHKKNTHDHQPDCHLNKLIMSFLDGICIYTIILHWICIEALKIPGSTLLKHPYFGFRIQDWFRIFYEEDKGAPGPLANCVKSHNSVGLADFLCGKSFLKFLHYQKCLHLESFDPSQCLIDSTLRSILTAINNNFILLCVDNSFLT